MELKGTQLVEASRSTVWKALNDPEVLAKCVDGCEELIRTGENSFAGTAVVKVGPVRASFKGDLELTDIIPEVTYTIIGQGKGGAAGFARGKVRVALSDAASGDAPATQLEYDLDAQVGGRLAQVGARLIQSACQSYIDSFFANFAEHFRSAGQPDGSTDANPANGANSAETPGSLLWLWTALLAIAAISALAYGLIAR